MESVCPMCKHQAKTYKEIKYVTPLKRHNTPGEALINASRLSSFREGPMLGQCAVLKRFHSKGFHPDNTLIVLYPSGMNSLWGPIYSTLRDLGYDVCIMYYDATTHSYF